MAIKYIVLFVETPRKFITAKLSIRKPGSSSVLININGFGSVAVECKRQQQYGQECFNHGLMLDIQLKAILIQIPLHAWTNFFIRVQSKLCINLRGVSTNKTIQ
jgi:hypothetical protein